MRSTSRLPLLASTRRATFSPLASLHRSASNHSPFSLPADAKTGPLHHEWIEPPNFVADLAIRDYPIVFLHGLLGNSRNIRTMAKKLCEATVREGIMLDITGHGKSPAPSPPNEYPVTFDTVVADIHTTLCNLMPDADELEKLQFVGHSLGGRLALHYATQSAYPTPRKLWLLDTVPGTPDKNVRKTLQAAASIEMREAPWKDQREITTALTQEHGLPPAIAMWLSSQFDLKEETQQRFAFSTKVALSLADEFQHHNFWEQAQLVQDQSSTPTVIHLVQGGQNAAWASEESNVHEHKAKHPSHFFHHILPNAGHWVHIDDPAGLAEAFSSDTNW